MSFFGQPKRIRFRCLHLPLSGKNKSSKIRFKSRLKKIPSTFGLSTRGGGNKEITEALPEEETNYL
jgi:hypothetical protein